MYLMSEDGSRSPPFNSRGEGSRIWLVTKNVTPEEDASQMVPSAVSNALEYPSDVRVADGRDLWDTTAHCTCARHLHLGNWFEPQAMPGRMAARLCRVSAVSTAGRTKLSFAAVHSGLWCGETSQWPWSPDCSDGKAHTLFLLLSFPVPVRLLCVVLR